ncbi:MAG: acetyl-CoA carboxylase biotin carboxylase subunit [Deltaproteobacteria bacterium]|nr:acetyl-CoA carboxylase biotin carboxylase subunit [Deltaproteobacteria bacterium]
MFSKVLVANRGEIAVRIMRTLREMGVGSVAIYSDADAAALHVLCADEAVGLGDPEPAASYLNAARIVAAARETGAEAIHPGYGFLSENAAFARLVEAAGLAFIGPPAEVIALLGDKLQARRLAAEQGVPTIPGRTLPGGAEPQALARAATEVGYPVLVKAAYGGGGKGMRVVRSEADLAAAASLAASEAHSAFGEGTVYLERFLARPRHVEIQILGDARGEVVPLGERECSIQRRYQKIIEETPSPALDAALRARLFEAAVAVARAAGYVNAGTVEFLLDADGRFYFLEVNTRLQVEHPITELVLGLDLVRHQLEIAAGAPLRITERELAARGHAIECRVYAEDPARGFVPAPGRIRFMQAAAGPGVRFDAGVYAGFEVPVHYDPLLGKLVVWAEDRPAALARMERALRENVILGVPTTTELTLDVISSEAFRAGDTHTRLLEELLQGWRPSADADRWALVGEAADRLLGFAAAAPGATGRGPAGGEPASPWQALGAWDYTR